MCVELFANHHGVDLCVITYIFYDPVLNLTRFGGLLRRRRRRIISNRFPSPKRKTAAGAAGAAV